MSWELHNPQQTTYWILSDGQNYSLGMTMPEQKTTARGTWQLYWSGTDAQQWKESLIALKLAESSSGISLSENFGAR